MFIDIGLYGEPNVSNYNSDTVKDLELFVLKSKGFKMMYVGTYLNIYMSSRKCLIIVCISV
ncbi:delta(24)-sterol reductase-like [Acyrthosiphon pisum]|uniref:Uncharacterized protein n=1 Tax=Acyrthosiphon pisum TaxID=7029 RepID=A0A8R2NSD9_ACYPI|nr:delta(24)-sterol reductase-like [Acyrthosiphon pisum]